MAERREKVFAEATKESGGLLVGKEDDREYRSLILSNQLKVLLIHDSSTEMAGAALEVHVGSFCDPPELPGLAHFLEHMLFLGTEKYPDEAGYNKFVESHGGYSNAWTADEKTNYRFTVTSPHLDEGLDRFSQFFISPLFTESATSRELNAVDSEHSKNLQDDYWRSNQILKQMADPNHPMSRFNVGSIETLETSPKEKGINVRKALIEFHSKYYSSNIMSLCVIGTNSLDELESMVKDKFSAIKNHGISIPITSSNAYTEKCTKKQINYIPVKDYKQLKVGFQLPSQDSDYRGRSASFLSNLIGHESDGSILEFLKDNNWATSLSCGLGHEGLSFSTFEVTIELTDDGINYIENIVTVVFQYLKMLKEQDSLEWFYDELSLVYSTNLRFKQKSSDVDSFISSFASNIHDYPDTKHWVVGNYLYLDFNKEYIKTLLEFMTPDNCIIMVSSPNIEGEALEEKWYKSKYQVKDIQLSSLETWTNVEKNESLFFPSKNTFIASDFSMLKIDDFFLNNCSKDRHVPVNIFSDSYSSLWYMQDGKFSRPEARVSFKLRSPFIGSSPISAAFAILFTNVVNEKLNKYAYYATLANLSYDLCTYDDYILIQLSGYNEKTTVLLEAILQSMIEENVDEDLFERVLEETQRDYRNKAKQAPYKAVLTILDCMMKVDSIFWPAIRDELEKITLEAYKWRSKVLLKSFNINSFVFGNCSKEDSMKMLQLTQEILKIDGVRAENLKSRREVQLPSHNFVFSNDHTNEEDQNSATGIYFQIGPVTPYNEALVRILQHVINQPFYDELRTNQQIGYLVWTYPLVRTGIVYLGFLIQSDKVSALEIDNRIETFLDGYAHTISSMTPEDFKTNIESEVVGLREKIKNSKDAFNRVWSEIDPGYNRFDKLEDIAVVMERLKLNEVVDFFNNSVSKNGINRKKLSIQVFSSKSGGKIVGLKEGNSNTTLVEDMSAFQNALPSYPSSLELVNRNWH